MLHPFINNLSDKSLEDLQSAITGLMTKLNFAYRTNNGPLIHQISMALESYKTEYAKKMDEAFKKQKIASKINIQKDT